MIDSAGDIGRGQSVAIWLLIAVAVAAVPACGDAFETERLYLSGTGFGDTVDWDFQIDRGRGAGSWARIAVPSQWETEGFGDYAYGMDDPKREERAEVARYRHEFETPERWRGRRVLIVFEGVMTDATVKVNGAGVDPTHRGGFTRFSFDLSDRLDFGAPNLLEVEVRERSADRSVNRAERRADYWVFGGIYRPVYLESFPERSVAHVAIDARHDGELTVELKVEGVKGGERLIATVKDLEAGDPVGGPLEVALTGTGERAELRGRIPSVRPWSAEHPHRYGLEVVLEEDGTLLHQVSRTFGFRSVDLRPGAGLFVNDRRVRLKGVNRHSIWPESGRTLNRELNRRDAELIKSLNANAVRTSHYPPDPDFLDACDEFGIYVIDELPGWHDAYRAGVGSRLIGEMVRRDVNHPSVILWANGNEGGWNSLLDSQFERHDPQKRPVLHPGSIAAGVNAEHYPSYDELRDLLEGDSVSRWVERFGGPQSLVLPTEMLHGLYDGGGGAGLEAFWTLISDSERGLGGFLWSLLDEGVVRTDRDDKVDTRGNYAPDGILGPFREPEAGWGAVRHLWSPVQLDAADWPAGRVRLENLYADTVLSELTLRWQALQMPGPDLELPAARVVFQSEGPGPEIEPGATGEVSMNVAPDVRFDALRLAVLDTDRREVNAWAGWSADYEDLLSSWRGARAARTEVAVEKPAWLGEVRSVGKGNLEALWRASTEDWMQADIEFGATDGFGLALPGFEVDSIQWVGNGPWPVWSNRLAGPILGAWQRELDDSEAPWRGARGFYSGVRWLKLHGSSGTLTVVVENDDLFVGVSAPRFPEDARDARADLSELGDLSFLQRIPGIGSKFHPAAALGPRDLGGPLASESGSIRLWFRWDPARSHGPGDDP